MKRLIPIITVLFALIVHAGCVTTAELDARLSPWVGQEADVLVTQWGAPSGTYQKKDGQKILTYERNSITTLGAGVDAKTLSRQCRIDFVTDAEGKIVSAAWHGQASDCGASIPQ